MMQQRDALISKYQQDLQHAQAEVRAPLTLTTRIFSWVVFGQVAHVSMLVKEVL
jgi:hypothetical protein